MRRGYTDLQLGMDQAWPSQRTSGHPLRATGAAAGLSLDEIARANGNKPISFLQQRR